MINYLKKCSRRLKKHKKQYEFIVIILMFVMAISFQLLGFHAIDLCRNELDIEHTFNNQLKDNGLDLRFSLSETTTSGKEYIISNGECHIFGSNLFFKGLTFFIVIIIMLLAKIYVVEGGKEK